MSCGFCTCPQGEDCVAISGCISRPHGSLDQVLYFSNDLDFLNNLFVVRYKFVQVISLTLMTNRIVICFHFMAYLNYEYL